MPTSGDASTCWSTCELAPENPKMIGPYSANSSMSVSRALRIGPTSGEPRPTDTAAKRVASPSMTSWYTTGAREKPFCSGRADVALSTLMTTIGPDAGGKPFSVASSAGGLGLGVGDGVALGDGAAAGFELPLEQATRTPTPAAAAHSSAAGRRPRRARGSTVGTPETGPKSGSSHGRSARP